MKNKGTLTLSGTLAFICITTISGKKSKRNKKKKLFYFLFFFFSWGEVAFCFSHKFINWGS